MKASTPRLTLNYMSRRQMMYSNKTTFLIQRNNNSTYPYKYSGKSNIETKGQNNTHQTEGET